MHRRAGAGHSQKPGIFVHFALLHGHGKAFLWPSRRTTWEIIPLKLQGGYGKFCTATDVGYGRESESHY